MKSKLKTVGKYTLKYGPDVVLTGLMFVPGGQTISIGGKVYKVYKGVKYTKYVCNGIKVTHEVVKRVNDK